jgi:hypothetical protein
MFLHFQRETRSGGINEMSLCDGGVVSVRLFEFFHVFFLFFQVLVFGTSKYALYAL